MKEKANSNEYREARAKWARANTALFLEALEKVGEQMGLKITPLQYVKAYKVCVEDCRFGYPAEFKVAEIIATDETYVQVLAIMTALMKRFRLDFFRTRQRRSRRRKKRAA